MITQSTDIRYCIIFFYSGGNFCAGYDLKELSSSSGCEKLLPGNRGPMVSFLLLFLRQFLGAIDSFPESDAQHELTALKIIAYKC